MRLMGLSCLDLVRHFQGRKVIIYEITQGKMHTQNPNLLPNLKGIILVTYLISTQRH